jgi:flagellar hook-associated protein 3 FlgL
MLVSIGDLAQTFLLKRQTVQAKADLQRLAGELGTGLAADPAARLRGDLGPLGAIEASLSRLSGYDAVTRDLSLVLGARQTALDQIDRLAVDGSARLLAVAQGAGGGLQSAASAAEADFAAAVSALNQRFADRSLFAGAAVDGPALAPADTILAAAVAILPPNAGASGIEAALDAWLADPAGFAAVAYLGGNPAPPVRLGTAGAVAGDVTALDPGLGKTMRGLLMAALLSQDALPADAATQARLARRAGEVLAEAAQDRAALQAGLGLAQGRVAEAEARNGAEATALQIARAGLLAADPHQTATALQEAEARLDLIFTLTARLSRLSLADRL